jgi:hypothetical protein
MDEIMGDHLSGTSVPSPEQEQKRPTPSIKSFGGA